MKRTTIMIEEELLHEIQQIAQQKEQSASSIIREALAAYVTRQYAQNPPPNPLLGLIGLGHSPEPTDVANGGDEAMLSEAVDPVQGWSVDDEPVS
jgi:metal-responsive CopG/Arc/MetJ family transcriptional regulator